MKPFNLLSVILGSLITICLLIVFENLCGMLYVIPKDTLILSHDLFIQEIGQLPTSFFVTVIGCNGAACYIGGMLPVIIGDERLKWSIYIGLIVTIFAIGNIFLIPFPVWYKIVFLLHILPFCYLGGFLTKRLFDHKTS